MPTKTTKQKSKAGELSANLDHSKAKITHNHHGVRDSILRDLIKTQREEIKFLMERNRELADRNAIIEKTVDITLMHLSQLIEECVMFQKTIKTKINKIEISISKKAG